jgi:hypothetical protein
MKKINIISNPKLLFKVFLIIYFIGGLTATILSLTYNYNKEYVGMAFVIGSLISLVLFIKFNYLNLEKDFFHQSIFTSSIFKLSIILYSILCMSLLYIFSVSLDQYYLPLEFFIIIFLISGIIVSQILLNNKLNNLYEKFILFEIIFLNIIVFYSFIFLFPSPYGNDAQYHVEFIKNSINAGYLIGEGIYQNYPVFHFLFIFLSQICKIENFKFIQFILLFVQSIIMIFWFLLTKKVFNTKIGLISTLIFSFAPYVSQSKFFYFPSSFTALFFVIILFFIFYNEKISLNYSLLLIILLMAVVFSHPMIPIILSLALLVILLTSKFQLDKEKITLNIILLFLITTVGWWMKPSDITASDLFTYSIMSIKNAIEKSDYYSVGSATLAPLMNKWAIISSDLGFILLICLSIIGSLFVLGNVINSIKYKNYNRNALYLAILTLVFIPIPYVLTIVYPQSLPNRWFPYIEILASVFASCSIYIFFNLLIKNKFKYIPILATAGLIFLLISNPVINPNSQLYANELSTRSALTNSEIDASNFIYQYSNVTGIKGNSKFISVIIPKSGMKNYVNPEKQDTYSQGLLVLRNYDIEKGFTIPLFGAKNKLLEKIYPNAEFYKFVNRSNEVYNNGNLFIYSP